MNLNRTRIPLTILALAATLGLGVAPAAAARKVTLHVEVTDPRTGEYKVRLNMPLKSVDALLEVVQDELDAELDFTAHGERFQNLKRIYLAIRDEDLSDFLEMQGDDGEYLKIWKDREAFRLEARDEDGNEKALVYLPLVVLDVLFSGESEPDLQGALRELRALAPLTLVSVDERRRQVRIWLD